MGRHLGFYFGGCRIQDDATAGLKLPMSLAEHKCRLSGLVELSTLNPTIDPIINGLSEIILRIPRNEVSKQPFVWR
jgi:hypothetical protein